MRSTSYGAIFKKKKEVNRIVPKAIDPETLALPVASRGHGHRGGGAAGPKRRRLAGGKPWSAGRSPSGVPLWDGPGCPFGGKQAMQMVIDQKVL